LGTKFLERGVAEGGWSGIRCLSVLSPVVKATAHDLLTGKIYAVPFEAKNGMILLQQLTIPDHPVALTFN
jgi:hypothetical protein